MNRKQNMGRLRAELRAAFGTPASQKPGTNLQALRAALRGEALQTRASARARALLVSESEYGPGKQGDGLELVQEAAVGRVVRVREVVCAQSEFPLD
jgi:hypothetical protein